MDRVPRTPDICRGSFLSFQLSTDQNMHMRKLSDGGKNLLVELERTLLGIHKGPGIFPSARTKQISPSWDIGYSISGEGLALD